MGAVDREVSSGHQAKHQGGSAVHVRRRPGRARVTPDAPSAPLYVYQPAPLQVPAIDPSYACVSDATDCTPQQACDLWGMNYDQLAAPVGTSADGALDASSTGPTAAADASTATGP
jgi:hypothetical protein